MLTGVKDAPSELGIPAENIQDEATGVFGLPAQGAFDLDDTPSLQDLLGGDINISTGDDLAEDSLLRETYYNQAAADDEKELD